MVIDWVEAWMLLLLLVLCLVVPPVSKSMSPPRPRPARLARGLFVRPNESEVGRLPAPDDGGAPVSERSLERVKDWVRCNFLCNRLFVTGGSSRASSINVIIQQGSVSGMCVGCGPAVCPVCVSPDSEDGKLDVNQFLTLEGQSIGLIAIRGSPQGSGSWTQGVPASDNFAAPGHCGSAGHGR